MKPKIYGMNGFILLLFLFFHIFRCIKAEILASWRLHPQSLNIV